MGSVLRLRVNGQERELPYSGAGATVLDLLSSLDLHPRTVAVELNRELVPRAGFREASLGDGDRIEIVRFVQGGSPPAECAAETGCLAAPGDRV